MAFIPLENRLRKSGYLVIAGIDEAGRGPLAGPVVSAAVVLAANTRLPGLNDSKQISEAKREELFPLIIEKALDFSISIVPHGVIDEINILEATKFANFCCIKHLQKTPDIVLIDGRDKQIFELRHQTIIKGDSKVRCIAAASILAKVTRDRLMQHYSKEFSDYKFEQHKGYGTREHRDLIKKYGRCEIHRKSFTIKPT